MTKKQALQEARRCWGWRAFVGREATAPPERRCCVGYRTVGGVVKRGYGSTWRVALLAAGSEALVEMRDNLDLLRTWEEVRGEREERKAAREAARLASLSAKRRSG